MFGRLEDEEASGGKAEQLGWAVLIKLILF
jgi:hypothetical protein